MTDYIGLLIVWFEVGKFGFGVYKYNKLLRMEWQAKLNSVILEEANDIMKSELDSQPRSHRS
jgi:hypothetical protein